MIWLVLSCRSGGDPQLPPVDTEPCCATGQRTGSTGATGATADTAATASMSFDAPAHWSQPGESRPQHHGSVALLEDGTLAVAWTEGNVFNEPTVWLRVIDLAGRVGEARPLVDGSASKPELVAGWGGVIAGYQVSDGGIAASVVSVPLGRVEVLPIVLPGPRTAGNNSVTLGLDGDRLYVSWFGGTRLGRPASFFLTRFDRGALLGRPPVLISDLDYAYDTTPDLALTPTGQPWIAWPHSSTTIARLSMQTSLRLDRFDPELEPLAQTTVFEEDAPTVSTPRPSLAIAGDGRAAVAFRSRHPIGEVDSAIVLLSPAGEVLGDPIPISGAGSTQPELQPLGSSAILVLWTEQRGDLDDEIWASVWSIDTGAILVAPQRLSDPGVSAERASASVLALEPGRWRIAVAWEQALGHQARELWGCLGEVSLPGA